jgi:hypothetical protein
VQCDKTAPAKRNTARERVEKAMVALKDKYHLADVTEEDGAKWSLTELARVDRDFAKVAKEDQVFLIGLRLIRTNTLGEKRRGGKTFKIAGQTSGTNVIRLAGNAFNPGANTILHEVGHLVNNRMAAIKLNRSAPKLKADEADAVRAATQLDARTKGVVTKEVNAYIVALNAVTDAGRGLRDSIEENRAEARAALEDAQLKLGMLRADVVQQLKDPEMTATLKAASEAYLKVEEKQDRWLEAIEKYLVEKDKANLTGFIDVVKKHNLARRIYRPFTDYVAAHWPAEPKEYFAEAFRAWRTDRAYMQSSMKPLFDFFEKGGHRGTGLEMAEVAAPVVIELGWEIKETLIDPVLPGK